jgi:hypothetical protein
MEARARPRRGAPPKGEESAREGIRATASELFYREGIRAIGVDTVVKRSGVVEKTRRALSVKDLATDGHQLRIHRGPCDSLCITDSSPDVILF